MAHQSDPTFHTLHAVRLRGRASTEAISHSLGPSQAYVDALLQAAADAGHIVYKEGRAAGWSLTPEGREAHAELVCADRDRCSAIELVRASYEQFIEFNQELIGVCTNWQVRPGGEMNDHSDASYDEGVIASLVGIDERVQPVCAQLGEAMERFGSYGARLGEALDKIRAGETQWFTSPMIDSYHTIWFELHEDLLQTLGIDRAKEGT